MSEIDWSKAPDWADMHGHACYGDAECWIGDDKYTYVDASQDGRVFAFEEGWAVHEFKDVTKRPPQAWSGHGLPPVGTVCEYYVDEDDWRQCEVVAHKDGYAVIWLNAAHVFSSRACGLLRPIRTPEQLAAEEREKAILEIYQTITISRAQAEAIYDAGYRKK